MANAKTIGTSLISWQDLAAASSPIISSEIDVSASGLSLANPASLVIAKFYVQLGRKDGTAFNTGFPNVYVQGAFHSSNNANWGTILPYQMAKGSSILNTTLNGALTAGGTTAVLTATTNFTQGDVLFLGDSSASNYEICQARSVSGSTVTFFEAYTNNHSNGAIVTSQAERPILECEVTGYNRIRLLIDVSNSGRDIRCQASYNLFVIP